MFRKKINICGPDRTLAAFFAFVIVFALATVAGYAQQEANPGAPAEPAEVEITDEAVPEDAPAAVPPYTGQPIPGRVTPQPSVPGQPPAPLPGITPVTPPVLPGAAAPAGISKPRVVTAPASPAAPVSPAVPTEPRPSVAAGGSSFFFDDADVFEVIQTVFGEVLRVNYIIDPSVKGRVNFRTTTPIPRDKILSIMEIIFRLNGIAVIEESGLYRIIPIGNIAKEPAPIRFGKNPDSIELKGTAVMQLVPLTYINSSEMTSILTPLLTQGGAIYDITKKNILIIADTDANVRRLLQVVAMFDVDTYKDASQPKIYVYPLQNSKAEHVAKILQQVLLGQAASSPTTPTPTTTSQSVRTVTSTGQQTVTSTQRPVAGPTASQQPHTPAASHETLVAPNTKIIADEVANSLVIFASPGDYSVILGAIRQIDTTPRQVMIEAVVASMTLTDNLTLGLRWNLSLNPKISIDPFSRAISLPGTVGFSPLPNLAGPNSDGSTFFSYTARDNSGNVKLLIEADASNGKAKILSSPNILVADNREARIQVGSQIPIATSTTTTPLTDVTTGTITGTTVIPTNSTTSTIQYKDVGTILKVKPQVNDSGLIALEISQEVSSADLKVVLGSQQYVITKNEISTNLVIQDGETIVIGGLINETTSYSRSGIPGVSKIPILGYLFGSTTDNVERQELVILLTPHVIRNQSEAKKMTTDYYELFKNVSKELDLEKHKKSTGSQQQSSEKAVPAAKEKVDSTTSPTTSKNKGGKTGQSEYPLKPED